MVKFKLTGRDRVGKLKEAIGIQSPDLSPTNR